MRFRAHETFFIRKGWINKGLRKISEDPFVFMGAKSTPMDTLGIGTNMVKSLRYWLQATGLTEEPTSGKRSQSFTDFGNIVYRHDPFIDEIGTLWLLHYSLALNEKNATAWYYFFNEFNLRVFSKDDFIKAISSYIKISGAEASLRSLEDDFTCILGTYISRDKTHLGFVSPENNIDCPLGDLELIDIDNKNKRTYKRRSTAKSLIPVLIVFAGIIDQAAGKREMPIALILNEPKSVGRVFSLDAITLSAILHDLELMGLVKVVRTAGLDVVKILSELTFLGCVEEYYKSIEAVGYRGDND